jgi:hypothetical protein
VASAELCDFNGCRRIGRRFVVTSAALDGGKIDLDLCDQHERPVRTLEEIARKAKLKQRRQRGAVTEDFLVSLIERPGPK